MTSGSSVRAALRQLLERVAPRSLAALRAAAIARGTLSGSFMPAGLREIDDRLVGRFGSTVRCGAVRGLRLRPRRGLPTISARFCWAPKDELHRLAERSVSSAVARSDRRGRGASATTPSGSRGWFPSRRSARAASADMWARRALAATAAGQSDIQTLHPRTRWARGALATLVVPRSLVSQRLRGRRGQIVRRALADGIAGMLGYRDAARGRGAGRQKAGSGWLRIEPYDSFCRSSAQDAHGGNRSSARDRGRRPSGERSSRQPGDGSISTPEGIRA